VEGLDRDEHRPVAQAEVGARLVLSGVGHTASVGTRRSHATGGAPT
jgi:hypothetical protein